MPTVGCEVKGSVHSVNSLNEGAWYEVPASNASQKWAPRPDEGMYQFP